MRLTDSFWELAPSCKYDVFEDQQARLILKALSDAQTRIEANSRRDWTMFGPEDALLVRVRSRPINLTMALLYSFLRAFPTM